MRSHALVLFVSACVGLVACSVNVGKGSGKPAGPADTTAPDDAGKPVASPGKPVRPDAPTADQPDPVRTSDPDPDPGPTSDGGPVRTADPGDGPTRTPGKSEPTRVAGDPSDDAGRAVCDVADEVLKSICHRALDPIAADDAEAFLAGLADDVVLVRPGPDGMAERARGKTRVHREMRAAGGLARFVHVRPGTRIVGTIVRDCRRCAKSYVAVQANTRAGRIIVTTDTASPPRVTQLELRADPRGAAPAREKGVR